MKTLLLVGGILLLILGVILFIVAIVVYLMGRNRAAKPAGAPAYRPPNAPPMQPGAQAPQGAPRPPAPPAPQPPRPAAPAPPLPPPPAPPPRSTQPAGSGPAHVPAAGETDSTVVAGSTGIGALHAISGPLSGQSFPLKIDGFYIGRDRTLAQVVIEDPSVSKRHVWVGVREGVITAVDQSSTNGTYLNTLGTRIGQVRLNPGDTLIISDDVARFVYRA